MRSLGGGGARCHRSAVPVRREGTGGCGFKELLSLFHVSQGFYLLGYLFALKRGGGKISFSCQAQHFPFRACPPPPLRDPHHPHPLPTKGTLPRLLFLLPLPSPQVPFLSPLLTLSPWGCQRPAMQPEGLGDRRGRKVGDKKTTLSQSSGGLLAFPRASLSPAGQIWGLCPPQSACRGSLARSGAQQREVFLF